MDEGDIKDSIAELKDSIESLDSTVRGLISEYDMLKYSKDIKSNILDFKKIVEERSHYLDRNLKMINTLLLEVKGLLGIIRGELK